MILPVHLFLGYGLKLETPSGCIGGSPKMISISSSSWQPFKEPWTFDHLNCETSILFGLSIDSSTAATYTSAMNAYLTFCKSHHLSIKPTPDTLGYYITYQTSFINPASINSYLSGISNQLESYYLDIHKNWALTLVQHMMKGAHHVQNSAVN